MQSTEAGNNVAQWTMHLTRAYINITGGTFYKYLSLCSIPEGSNLRSEGWPRD